MVICTSTLGDARSKRDVSDHPTGMRNQTDAQTPNGVCTSTIRSEQPPQSMSRTDSQSVGRTLRVLGKPDLWGAKPGC